MQQNQGNGIQISLGWGNDRAPGVVFMIPASTFIEMPDGEPRPGIVLSSAGAKEIAFALLLNAQQLDNGLMPTPAPK